MRKSKDEKGTPAGHKQKKNIKMKKKTTGGKSGTALTLMIIVITTWSAIVLAGPAQAMVKDEIGINKTLLTEEAEEFTRETGLNLSIAVLQESEDLLEEAEQYYNGTGSDIIIVYDFGRNRITIATPVGGSAPLTSTGIEGILENRIEEKSLITTQKEATSYLATIINDLREGMTPEAGKEGTAGYCALIKDGVCNQSCPGDPDCQCGNSICEFHENYETCPEDCSRTEDFTCAIMSDNYCDKNCPVKDIDCAFLDFNDRTFSAAKRKKATATALKVIVGAVLFMLIAILIFIIERKKGLRKEGAQ
ncbi:MAG: hypothetical protein R6U32_06190 [Candidatus Woesearchaeota archaeon]